jgi:hypothetical protein
MYLGATLGDLSVRVFFSQKHLVTLSVQPDEAGSRTHQFSGGNFCKKREGPVNQRKRKGRKRLRPKTIL